MLCLQYWTWLICSPSAFAKGIYPTIIVIIVSLQGTVHSSSFTVPTVPNLSTDASNGRVAVDGRTHSDARLAMQVGERMTVASAGQDHDGRGPSPSRSLGITSVLSVIV